MNAPAILTREQVERLAAEGGDGSYERDAIATAADLYRRLDELRAAIAGRTEPPTDAEIDALAAEGGVWLWETEGMVGEDADPQIARRVARQFREPGRSARWWAMGADRLLRPWPYAPLAPEAPGGGATTEAVLAELAERHPEDAEKLRAVLRVANGEGTPAECRVCAGLTVRMAAKVTGLASERIEAIKQGAVASAEEFALLAAAYDVPGWAR